MTLLDVVVCVCVLALAVVAVYGLMRFLTCVADVTGDLQYLNASFKDMDILTKSLNTQMHHANVRIQVLVEKINELECHQNQLKKNMLVMHENNLKLHDKMTMMMIK